MEAGTREGAKGLVYKKAMSEQHRSRQQRLASKREGMRVVKGEELVS
jgi:hypothetical protein